MSKALPLPMYLTEEGLTERMRYFELPEYMDEAVLAYVFERRRPGDFLTALLRNDFKEAIWRADENNSKVLRRWASFLHNELPGSCHGSEQRVSDWLKAVPTKGAETTT